MRSMSSPAIHVQRSAYERGCRVAAYAADALERHYTHTPHDMLMHAILGGATPQHRRGAAAAEATSSATTIHPDKQVMRLWKTLHSLRTPDGKLVEWTPHQHIFIFMMLSATLPGIYGDAWESNADRVMRKWRIKRVCLQAMMRCPRQWGKTFAIAGFAAAYALSVSGRGQRIAVFSTGARTSTGMLENLEAFIRSVPGGSERIVSSSKGGSITPHIDIRAANGTINTISAYPGNPKISIFLCCILFCAVVGD